MTNSETAIFAGGCFWCTEAIFQRIKGILKATSGYATSLESDLKPTYLIVSSGMTNFAECTKIDFDSSVITFNELVYIFLRTHDPTTLNRQGADVGPQYRSAIFYTSDKQKQIALDEIADANTTIYNGAIVTRVEMLDKFYVAEEDHQDYYSINQTKPYCQIVINPKLEKFNKEFKKYLK